VCISCIACVCVCVFVMVVRYCFYLHLYLVSLFFCTPNKHTKQTTHNNPLGRLLLYCVFSSLYKKKETKKLGLSTFSKCGRSNNLSVCQLIIQSVSKNKQNNKTRTFFLSFPSIIESCILILANCLLTYLLVDTTDLSQSVIVSDFLGNHLFLFGLFGLVGVHDFLVLCKFGLGSRRISLAWSRMSRSTSRSL